MSIQVRIRRDTLINLNSVTPADGEMAYNTTDDRLHMGDGATAGGIPHVNFKDAIKNYFNYASAVGGTGNAITITLPYAALSYTAGMKVHFKAGANNSGATTVNVSSLGAKNIYATNNGVLGACAGGEILNGNMYTLEYDGTQFQLFGYVPTVETPGMKLLGTATASSSAALTFPSLITSAYNLYMLELDDIKPATDNTDLWLRTSSNNGSSYDSSAGNYLYGGGGYVGGSAWNNWVASGSVARSNGDTKIIMATGIGNAAAECFRGRLFIPSPLGTAAPKSVDWHGHWLSPTGDYQGVYNSAGWRLSNSAVNSLQILMSSGNIASGKGRLYGFKV